MQSMPWKRLPSVPSDNLTSRDELDSPNSPNVEKSEECQSTKTARPEDQPNYGAERMPMGKRCIISESCEENVNILTFLSTIAEEEVSELFI